MNHLYKLIEDNPTNVIIEVPELSLLDKARYPEIPEDTKYITVTKGEKHSLIVTKLNGSRFNFFDWGSGGSTLISDTLQRFKSSVLEFLNTNCISIDTYDITKATGFYIYYNKNFKDYQVSFKQGDEDYGNRSFIAKSMDELLDILSKRFEFTHDFDEIHNRFIPLIKHYEINQVL